MYPDGWSKERNMPGLQELAEPPPQKPMLV